MEKLNAYYHQIELALREYNHEKERLMKKTDILIALKNIVPSAELAAKQITHCKELFILGSIKAKIKNLIKRIEGGENGKTDKTSG